MNEYICSRCGARSYSSATYESLKNKNCEKCGAPVFQSFSRGDADKKPKGDIQMKETNALLCEQIERLSEASKRKGLAPAELCGLSGAMVEITRALFECYPLSTFRPESAGQPNKAPQAAATLTTKAARRLISSATVQIRGQCKAKVCLTTKGKIKVARSETRSCDLESGE